MPVDLAKSASILVVSRHQQDARRVAATIRTAYAGVAPAPRIKLHMLTRQRAKETQGTEVSPSVESALSDAVMSPGARGATAILLPDLEFFRFLDALAPFSMAPIVDIAKAIIKGLVVQHPAARSIALLTSLPHDFLAALAVRFAASSITLRVVNVAPDADLATVCALLKQAASDGSDVAWLDDSVRSVCEAEPAHRFALPLLDVHSIYARAALAPVTNRAFKLGVVGGVGPAATVAFLDKLIKATPATRDQEHLKVVVEQNPQIPDRTEHLVGAGPDPTMALLATCRSLEEHNASAIVIPCNTAHAFITRIQPSLRIPVVHMIAETIRFITQSWPQARAIGLLATDGTIRSGVYHAEAQAAGLDVLTPGARDQHRVMDAIYGPQGVKAGHVSPGHRAGLERVIAELAARGAHIVILGCTELPLLIAQNVDYTAGEKRVPVVDPTQVLATRCVELATTANAGR